MGTRNITQVVLGGKPLLSRYCQWDGYLESAGASQLAFLNGTGYHERFGGEEPTGNVFKFERKTFIENLKKVVHLTKEQMTSLWDESGADGSGWVGLDVAKAFAKKSPYLIRDCSGACALAGIQSGKLTVTHLDLGFVNDSLFCEWAYVLDLDKNVWEIYKGFNRRPLAKTARFYNGKKGLEYYPVRLLKSYSLNRLPKTLKSLMAKEDKED